MTPQCVAAAPADVLALFTEDQRRQLLINGDRENRRADHYPVAWLFYENGRGVFLLTELDPWCRDLAFGFFSHDGGYPGRGTLSLRIWAECAERLGMILASKPGFAATYALSVYARAAYAAGGKITDAPFCLNDAAKHPRIPWGGSKTRQPQPA